MTVDLDLTRVYASTDDRGGRAIYARAFRHHRALLLASLRRVGR